MRSRRGQHVGSDGVCEQVRGVERSPDESDVLHAITAPAPAGPTMRGPNIVPRLTDCSYGARFSGQMYRILYDYSYETTNDEVVLQQN